MVGDTLTLTYDTSLMSVTDTLQIFADIEDGTQSLLYRIFNILASPLGYDKSLQRQRGTVVVETLPTLGNVTTVTNLTSLNGIDGYNARIEVFAQNLTAWAQCVRARIS